MPLGRPIGNAAVGTVITGPQSHRVIRANGCDPSLADEVGSDRDTGHAHWHGCQRCYLFLDASPVDAALEKALRGALGSRP
jgi:hypothetical protein